MDEGYLGIFRKFFDHEFWGEKRQYSKAEAWIDLMQCARYSDKPETLLDKRGSYILEYGDVYISLRYLGERWQWSKNKVRHFLEYLEKRESITFKKRDSHRTIVNITKLRVYTKWIKGERDSEGTVEGQSRDSEGTKKKKVKKEKKETIDPLTGFKDFYKAYPKKKNKGQAEKTWIKLAPTNDLLEEILVGIERAKKSEDWTKDNGKYIPHPSTWLNAKGWEDEAVEAKDYEVTVNGEPQFMTKTEYEQWKADNGR